LWKALVKGFSMAYYTFGFGEKLYKLCSNEGFKSAYSIQQHMFIGFARGPPRSKKVVSNTCRNSIKCLLDPSDIGVILEA
jgi:hypothetical protein